MTAGNADALVRIVRPAEVRVPRTFFSAMQSFADEGVRAPSICTHLSSEMTFWGKPAPAHTIVTLERLVYLSLCDHFSEAYFDSMAPISARGIANLTLTSFWFELTCV